MTTDDGLNQRIAKTVAELTRGSSLSSNEELLVGLSFAAALERTARTPAEWREAMRCWLKVVARHMRAKNVHPELISVAFEIASLLGELERGQQPPQLTAVRRIRNGED